MCLISCFYYLCRFSRYLWTGDTDKN